MTDHSRKYKLILTFIILTMISLLPSCKQKILGYGVLLWSPNENILTTGSILPVVSESKINDTYTIKIINSKELIEIPKWRIKVFETEADAKKTAEKTTKYKTIFAHNLKDGLLIREEADVTSPRVYKMKKGQIVKIIGRTEDIKQVGQYNGFWYNVLTEDGTEGYCFDHYLDVYDSSIPPEKQIDPAEKLIAGAFSKNYHPAQFVSMIKNSTIVLDSFKPQIGLFPDLQNKTVTVTTGQYSVKYTWDRPVLVDKRTFELGDTNFEVSVLSDTHIRATYRHEGEKIITDYYVIDNMEEIISGEMDRREALYETLLNGGTSYLSNAYGTIQFYGSRNFTWKNYSRLVPQVIPENAGITGKIYFDIFISPDISSDNDGVLTFHFSSAEKKVDVYFMYKLSENKLKLTYVPDSYILNHLVVRRTASPLILAFKAE